jgi:hypothetical protein
MAFEQMDVARVLGEAGVGINEAIVVGGAALDLAGLRPAQDIDVIVTPTCFARLLDSPEWNSGFYNANPTILKNDPVEAGTFLYLGSDRLGYEDLLPTCQEIGGVTVAGWDLIIEAKINQARIKDINDISLIRGICPVV